MADFIDEIDEEQVDDMLLDDEESAAIITSPEISPGLYEHFKVTADKASRSYALTSFW